MQEYKTKTLKGYLVINWTNDDIRLRKTTPNVNPTEMALELSIDVKVPKKTIPEISHTIEIPSVQILDAVAEVYSQEAPQSCPDCGSGKVALYEKHGFGVCTDCGVRFDIFGGGME